MNKVIVISGPTGIGKTNLAIKLATIFNLPIINSDASQMRKNMDIGTANINEEEFAGINHYLFKFLEPTSDFSIKDYQDLARPIIENNKCLIMVGGSGLYIDAALLDYDLSSDARDKDLDYDLSNEELYDLLKEKDPLLASKTHPNNRKRVLRYLEIAGKVTKQARQLYDILYISLDCDRNLLYERINKRFDLMIEEGWLEEVKRLRNDGYEIDKIKEIGYKELNDYLEKGLDFNNVSDIIKQKTRNYAKRQLTWFRGSANKYQNYHVVNNNDIDLVIKLVKEFIE